MIQSASYLVCFGKREKKREKKTREKKGEKKSQRKKKERKKKKCEEKKERRKKKQKNRLKLFTRKVGERVVVYPAWQLFFIIIFTTL